MCNRGRPLSWGLREEIVRRVTSGEALRSVARSVGVARDTAAKYSKRARSLGQNR